MPRKSGIYPLRERGDGGFTLVELLVALALSAILLSIVAEVFYQAGKATNTALGRATMLSIDKGLLVLFDGVMDLDSIHVGQQEYPDPSTTPPTWYVKLTEGDLALPNTFFGVRYLGQDGREHYLWIMDRPGIDDDHDGKTDEDPHDGVDNDGDGKIDEDGMGTLGIGVGKMDNPLGAIDPDSVRPALTDKLVGLTIRLYVVVVPGHDQNSIDNLFSKEKVGNETRYFCERKWQAGNGYVIDQPWDHQAGTSSKAYIRASWSRAIELSISVTYTTEAGTSTLTVVRAIHNAVADSDL